MKKKIKCDIYIRVSTTMQVDGYSLDAQREKLKRYAEFQNMEIVNEYSDEGKSGKSVEGRPEFQRMLDNIENGTDEVQFVLVFKLSRFGRNAADVLNSLQRMQDFGVNLICVEDGIDSSKDSGKLMISVLSAVAEIERENILVQTMEGRKQKAREGKWNGGFAPYGYELVNGELQIAEDEAEIIRLIYDKFIHTNMGISAIAAWLNQHGYKKKKRQNNTLDAFASSFIKGVLDNPVYCGKLAYGRRKNEKVSGTRNEYRIVKQENYMLHDGIHEGIISETDWELAHQKREKTGVKYEKTHSLDHEHILSGILRCPLCGSGMYGNVNRKKKKDGTLYKDYFYYACKHRRLVDGHKCGYRKSNYDSLCLMKDIAVVGTQAVGVILINMVISLIHGLYYDPEKYSSRDVYEVKTRKILLYSNLISTASNVLWVGGNAIAGNEAAWKDLDIGGIIVTMYRLVTDTKFIQSVKEEFVLGGFRNMIKGEDLNLLEVELWD